MEEVATVQLQGVHGVRRERRPGVPGGQLRGGLARGGGAHGRRGRARAHRPPQEGDRQPARAWGRPVAGPPRGGDPPPAALRREADAAVRPRRRQRQDHGARRALRRRPRRWRRRWLRDRRLVPAAELRGVRRAAARGGGGGAGEGGGGDGRVPAGGAAGDGGVGGHGRRAGAGADVRQALPAQELVLLIISLFLSFSFFFFFFGLEFPTLFGPESRRVALGCLFLSDPEMKPQIGCHCTLKRKSLLVSMVLGLFFSRKPCMHFVKEG